MNGSRFDQRSVLALVVTGLVFAGTVGSSSVARAAGRAMAEAPVAPVEPAMPEAPSAPVLEAPAPADKSPAAQPSPLDPAKQTLKAEPSGPGPFPVGMTAIFSQALGEGTFARNPYVRNPYYGWSGSIRPQLRLPFGFALSMRQDVELEWTKSESTTYDKQPLLADTRFGIRYDGLKIPLIGLRFILYSGLRAPISLMSRYRRQLGTMDLSATVDWSKWGFHVAFGAGAAANLRMRGKPVFDNSIQAQWWGTDSEAREYTDRYGNRVAPQRCISRSSDEGGCPATAFKNGSLGDFRTTTVLGYDLSALTPIPISFEASLVTVHAVSDYVARKDGYTPQYANLGFYGLTGRDQTMGSLSIGWQVFDWMALDISTSSIQPLMYGTNKYPRFPFWNIPWWDLKNIGYYSGADNMSSISTGVTFIL